MGDGAGIRILEDGPYEVTDVALARTAIIADTAGESVDWEPLQPIEVDRRYRLCRCGRSKTKPFCDDSHEEGFDGTEVADRGPRVDRAEVWGGDDLVLTDDRSLCTHAGFCIDRADNVWDMVEAAADPAVRGQLQRRVFLCPSGRLALSASPDADDVEPGLDPSVVVTRDGPLWVRGGVTIGSEDGRTYEVRNRVTLCRCGASRNKPFCDGSHVPLGFRDG